MSPVSLPFGGSAAHFGDARCWLAIVAKRGVARVRRKSQPVCGAGNSRPNYRENALANLYRRTIIHAHPLANQ